MLEFVGDAICLSGLTGTKLKSEVIGQYYPFWWSITSGGKSRDYSYPTALVELNAATGEVHIPDIKEMVLGSAGHALELKITKAPHTRNLKVVLVESNAECYARLKRVIKRRWPSVSIGEAEGPIASNSSNIYLLNVSLDEALKVIENLELGNTIYFFDPLRSVEWTTVEKVADKRMKSFYQTGTEFLIFLFTSDWFLGRDDLAPLPSTIDESTWTEEEKRTVSEADALFGNEEWRNHILNKNPIKDKEQVLVELYKNKLYKWFRYVLPLPFNPKSNQLFHLILCSNYEAGIRMTRDEYTKRTGNPKYSPNNVKALERFKNLHPEIFRGLRGKTRPLEWKILWKIITQHEDGRCDCMCRDLCDIADNLVKAQRMLEWLEDKRYLETISTEIAWKIGDIIKLYKLDWKIVTNNLGIEAPSPLTPLSPEQASRRMMPEPEEL